MVSREVGNLGSGVSRRLKIAGFTVLAAAAVGAVAALVLRDQVSRHRRDIFSPNSFERLAALAYLGKAEATVDNVMLLRDYIAWEPRRLLRRRARAILDRMEHELERAERAGTPQLADA